jgi:hypothetical protein
VIFAPRLIRVNSDHGFEGKTTPEKVIEFPDLSILVHPVTVHSPPAIPKFIVGWTFPRFSPEKSIVTERELPHRCQLSAEFVINFRL